MTQEQRNKKAGQLRLAAQIIKTGCEWEVKLCSGWFPNGHIQTAQWGCPLDAINSGLEIRIKEPVIPVPEGWRELRDDEKCGDFILGARYLSEGSKEWCSLTSGCYAHKPQRIIVPVAKQRVPLEPCDVPPGSVVRAVDGMAAESGGWSLILVATKNGITAINKNGRPELFSWEFAMNNQEIKVFGHPEWQPCSKPAL